MDGEGHRRTRSRLGRGVHIVQQVPPPADRRYEAQRELGNLTDAVNQVQVDDRADLPLEDILRRLEAALPRFERVRRRVGVVGKALPMYEGSVLGLSRT